MADSSDQGAPEPYAEASVIMMKESAVTALSYLKAHADTLSIDNRVFDQYDLHVHVPAGAVPKDGPSAGITIFTALDSIYTQSKVRDRLAMNAPIQGSAADIIKLAMINVYNKLNERKLKSELILQVHDELILNVKEDEFEEVKKLVADEMENAIKLKVALDVDVNFGHTWYEAK